MDERFHSHFTVTVARHGNARPGHPLAWSKPSPGAGTALVTLAPMNIEKLEAILGQMRAPRFADVLSAEIQVEKWAAGISDAITEHLMAGLMSTDISTSAPPLAVEPGGHGWEERSY